MKSSFAWNTQIYESVAVVQRLAGIELLEEVGILQPEKSPAEVMKRYRSILDVGCGTGALAIFLAGHLPGGRVVGTDVSSTMIQRANELARTTELTNLEFLEVDALALGISEDFDLIISNMVFHWIHDASGLLSEIYKALARGGTFAVQFPLVNEEEHLLVAVMNQAIDRLGLKDRYRDWNFPWFATSSSAYAELLKENGFSDVTAKVFHDEYLLTKEEFFRFYGAVGMSLFLTPLNEEESARLTEACEDVVEEYLEHSHNKVRFGRLVCLARKEDDR